MREDKQTLQIEINVQSCVLTQEEQIRHTTDEEETEEQHWASKDATLIPQPQNLL